MLDAIAIVSSVVLVALSLIYVTGCDRLKGTRP